jgi:MSHA pilin protein MshD
MSNSRLRGFTLIEMVIAILVLGIGLAGVLLAFQTTVRRSADPLVQRQMLALTEGLLDEVLSRPFAPLAGGSSSGCARDAFNDIDDYNGYAPAQVCDVAGNAIASLAGYRVSVSVTATNLAGVSAKRIQVTATRGSDTLSLLGWRTDFAS